MPILLSAGIPSRVNMKYRHRKGVWQQVRHAFLPLWTSAFQANIRCTTHTHRNTQKQLVRPTRSASLVRGHTPFRYPQHPVPRWAKLWQILRSIFLHGTGPLGPLLRPSDVRIGLVSTLRDVEDQFLQWLEWFRLIGFAHVFLYFDDPSYDEAAIATARSTYSGEFVSFALNTPELRKEWMTLKTWSKFSPFTDDRMCRQLLNIAHALKRAGQTEQAAESVDWMFHLDHDELFLPPPQGLQAHFKHLEAGNCRLCLYQNFEAAPQDHTLTPFLDVNLFKIPSGRVSKTPLGAAGMNFWAQRTKARNYFLYYDNGKSAVRVKKHKDIAPTSVHLLYPPDELEDFITGKKGWTTFPDHELADMNLTWMSSCHEEIVVSAKVLHYPATHFDRLWRKYKHLGNFPAVRFGGELVVPASFHLEARDEFLKHRDEKIQQQKLKELLEHAAFLRSCWTGVIYIVMDVFCLLVCQIMIPIVHREYTLVHTLDHTVITWIDKYT